ncbi:MAG TPA: transporter [Pseudolabrys sp.]|nr:transporter [Pseudolabrys sp.]
MLAAGAPARAMEAGQSPYLKGYTDFGIGVLPPPGVVLRNDLYFYSAAEHSQVPQGQATAHLKTVTDILGLTVSTPYEFLGARYAFAVRGAWSSLSADQTLAPPAPRPAVARDGRLDAFNDAVISPLILGWQAGNLHWVFSVPVRLPVGAYDKNRVVNAGRNVYALMPEVSVTYLDPKSGWEVSGTALYAMSSNNTDTNYKSGNIVHIDAAAGKMLTPRFKLGVAGYYAQQISDDSGAGAIYGARRLRILGVGPVASFSFVANGVPMTLVAKYYREFDAQNTTQGDAGMLSLRTRF